MCTSWICAPPTPAAVAVAAAFEAAYEYVGADDGLLYFLTSLDAPNGRVIAIDPLQAADRATGARSSPRGAMRSNSTSSSVTLVAHQLIVRSIHDAHSRVTLYGLDGAARGEIALPGFGTATGFTGHAG